MALEMLEDSKRVDILFLGLAASAYFICRRLLHSILGATLTIIFLLALL